MCLLSWLRSWLITRTVYRDLKFPNVEWRSQVTADTKELNIAMVHSRARWLIIVRAFIIELFRLKSGLPINRLTRLIGFRLCLHPRNRFNPVNGYDWQVFDSLDCAIYLYSGTSPTSSHILLILCIRPSYSTCPNHVSIHSFAQSTLALPPHHWHASGLVPEFYCELPSLALILTNILLAVTANDQYPYQPSRISQTCFVM